MLQFFNSDVRQELVPRYMFFPQVIGAITRRRRRIKKRDNDDVDLVVLKEKKTVLMIDLG